MRARITIVLLSFALLAILDGPDVRRWMGHPLGLSGVYVNVAGGITGVAPNAAAAGVRIGDAFDFAHATGIERFAFMALGTADAGERVAVPLVRGNHHFTAVVTTVAEPSESIAMALLRDIVNLLTAVLGALVLLRRPSVATWGFFFLMLIGVGPINDVYCMGPFWWRVVAANLTELSNVLPPYGAIFFALHLLRSGPLPRWRQVVQGITIAFAIAAAASSFALEYTLLFSPAANPLLGWAASILSVLPLFAAPIVLLATYFESTPNVRERLRWIIGGFSIAFVCNVIDQLGTQGNLGVIPLSYVAHSLLECGIYLAIGFPVAYAVLKHHIIDVDVAISRATVYTVLSVAIVGAFALVDLFFTSALSTKSAGLIADIGLALVLGFSFNTLHRHVDLFVDRILFRKRHSAEQHIAGLAVAMRYAQSESHVRSMLLDEPVRAFALSGAQLFGNVHAGPDGVQTLASYAEAKRAAVRLTDGQWNLGTFLRGDWTPAVAIPIFSHNALDAIAVYGIHTNGTDVDAQEIALLERLSETAGAAFDRLEADKLRRENAILRGEAPAY